MVAQHYRWDFIGLSTDTKPTPETSEKVVDGSTFYCSDNSKLYVFCGDQWYEKTVSGGGGGTSDFDQLTNRPKYNGTAMTGETNIPLAPSVVQTTGTSETDVMSQKAVTSMVFADAGTNRQVQIGYESSVLSGATNGTAVGWNSHSEGANSIAIGKGTAQGERSIFIGNADSGSIGAIGKYSTVIGSKSLVTSEGSIALGYGNTINNNTAKYSIALGSFTNPTRAGEINIGGGLGTSGFNGTAYRLISGLHDGQDLHDAATVAQGNTLATSAPTTSTVGVLGQLYTDTTNMHTYQCTAISGDTYTWTQRW